MKKIDTLITKNKKAYFDYEVLDSWEAWIELKWYETKSIRQKHVNLKWAYIVGVNGELYVKGMHVTVWKALVHRSMVDSEAPRKIFLKRKNIDYLMGKSKEAGYSLIPLELYFKGSLIKMRVWLAKWKKAYQKKQVLKERAMDKQAKLAMKKYI